MEDFKALVLARVSEANLHAFLLSKGCPFEILEDVIQETFIKVLSSSISKMCLPVTSSIRTFAKNQMIDHLRANKTRRTETLSVVLDQSDSALEAICVHERRILIRKALESLPHVYRVTLELVEIDGQSYSAAAAYFEVGIETIRTRLQRAKKKLKEIYLTFVHEEN